MPGSSNKVPYNKPPLSLEAQLEQLQARGIVVSDEPLALHYLGTLNYYRLGAYWLPFEENHARHKFIEGTEFDQILNLYIFDRELRLLLLDAIERIEVAIRTRFAYRLGHAHGAHAHLNAAIFQNTSRHSQHVARLTTEMDQSREDFIRHLKQKYQEPLPPIWAAVELMTLGQLSSWYGNLKHRRDLKSVSDDFNMGPDQLKSFLHHISIIRNLCAHHGRVWNREFTITLNLPTGPIGLSNCFNSDPPNNRKIYNTLVLLVFLLNKISPNHSWKNRLAEQLNRYSIDVSRMGFPADWKAKQFWLE